MSDRYLFTVFTPTYNRAETLPRVYASLLQQTFQDFEWLVVDDGSTDNTRELLEQWQQEAWFPVRYFWQANQHKKVAFNRGVREAQGTLLLTLDSDDEILPETLAIFQRIWFDIPVHKRHRYSAVTGLCVYPDGQVVGDRYPKSPLDSDSLESYHRFKVRGDKFGFQRTDVLRKFPFPEDIRGLVPESVVWFAIARDGYVTRYVNEILLVVHQTENSIIRAKGSQLSALKNADGRALFAKEQLDHDLPRWFRLNPKDFFKEAAWYTRFHLHLARQQPGKKYSLHSMLAKILVGVMWPVGFAFFVRDYFHWRSAK